MRDVPFAHQLEVTDGEFIGHLRLPVPLDGLDAAEVRRVVANHFRTRKSPAWSYWSHGSAWHQTDAVGSVIEKADALFAGRFRNSWPPHQWLELGKGPDWKKGLQIARTSVARGTWLCELSTAFALTGEVRYAAKGIELLKSFVRATPFVLDPRFEEDHDTYFGGEADTTQLTSYRLFRMTDFLFSGAMHAPGVCGDDDVFWLVKQIWFLASQYYRLVDDELRRDNHHLLDHGHLPFAMALAFPEFRWSGEMLKAGARVIRHHFGHNLMKDGAYAEHSTNYQYHVLFHYSHPHGLAKANGYRLFTARQVAQLRKWVEFCARAGKPDGTFPSIGDEPGRPLYHLFGTVAAPVMDKHLAAMARGLGCTPGTHKYATAARVAARMKKWSQGKPLGFGVSEYYTKPVTRPSPRELPKPATCQYSQGGYTFFRSGWTADADYLAVSHFSEDYGGHAHWDPMSFILHTKGKTIIGDPASWLYVSPKFHGHGGDHRREVKTHPLPYRGYSYSVNAHNCLVMNDDTLKPLEAMNHGTFWGGWPPKHKLGVFEAGGPIEVAEVSNQANDPTVHRRFFVHVVGVGFVLVDVMSKRPNLAPHEYAQYFHFEGDVKIEPVAPGSGEALRASIGEAACVIVPGAEVETRWKTYRDPYLEDVYGVPNEGGGPWVARLVRRIRGEAVFAQFLLTGQAAQTAQVRARNHAGQQAAWLDWQRAGVSANWVELGEAGSLMVACSPFGYEVRTEELVTDAELAVVQIDGRGIVRAWAMVGGSQLSVGGRKFAGGRRRNWAAG